MDPQQVLDKIIRLLKLDTRVFDEVKGDATQTIPAVVTAVVATLIYAVGGWLWWILKDYGSGGELFVKSVVLGSLFAVGLWFVWVFVVYALLTSVFKATSDVQSLIRTMGYAAAPLALGVVMLIPALSFGLGIAALVVMFAATNYAIQATTNAAPDKVLLANLAGFAIWAVVLSLLVSGDDPFGPGVFIQGALADR